MTRLLRRGRSRVYGLPSFKFSAHEEAHGTRALLYTRTGALNTTPGQDLTVPRGCRIVSWWMNLETAPSGGDFKCDALVDGVTIFEDGDLPTITNGNKEMDEVRVLGENAALIADAETLEIKPDTINGAAGLQVWLEIDIGEDDG